MKVIEENRFIDSNKPFSIFGVSDILYYNSSLDEQTIELFENTPTDFGDKINGKVLCGLLFIHLISPEGLIYERKY